MYILNSWKISLWPGIGGGFPAGGGGLKGSIFCGSGAGGGIDLSRSRREAVQRMSVYEVRRGDGDLRRYSLLLLKTGVLEREFTGELEPLPYPFCW